jgi:hypothetical protein
MEWEEAMERLRVAFAEVREAELRVVSALTVTV